ncbi:hypothetical protein EDB85DRAFT_2283313 [Lactarius pseudohatsudake]|nr:hypothetical protein EDB85DRAFT_2283313 [Lactarius pseudohatsudake]
MTMMVRCSTCVVKLFPAICCTLRYNPTLLTCMLVGASRAVTVLHFRDSVSQYALRSNFLWFSVTSGFSCLCVLPCEGRSPSLELEVTLPAHVELSVHHGTANVRDPLTPEQRQDNCRPLPQHDYDNCLLNHVDNPALADPGLTCQERRDVGFMHAEGVRIDEVLPVFNTLSWPNVLTPRFTHNIEAHYLPALLAMHYRTIPVRLRHLRRHYTLLRGKLLTLPALFVMYRNLVSKTFRPSFTTYMQKLSPSKRNTHQRSPTCNDHGFVLMGDLIEIPVNPRVNPTCLRYVLISCEDLRVRHVSKVEQDLN